MPVVLQTAGDMQQETFMTNEPMTVHVQIEGRVQGVGYRAWCAQAAEARGLSGWVRNLGDGSVEAVFTGGADTVVEMMDALWEGPSFARVNIIKNLDPVDPQAGAFTVRDTA